MRHDLRFDGPSKANPAELATHLQRMREQERAHLSRELHDELGALLMAAKLDVACLKATMAAPSPEIARRLEHLGETLNFGIALKRRIVEGLCPSSLANLGLVASLQIIGRDFGLTSGIEVSCDLAAVALDDWTALAVYRLVQESLTNIAKYAGATKAQIVLATQGEATVVAVVDNGNGFDVAQVQSNRHGLTGIRHRIEACGGSLKVTSRPGKGTRVVAWLPKPRDANADTNRYTAGLPEESGPAVANLKPSHRTDPVRTEAQACD
jgi:signal transduction histidine kinase